MVSTVIFTILYVVLNLFGISFAANFPQYWSDATQVGLGCLYFDTANQMNWLEAQESCKSKADTGHLVEIFSEEQQIFLEAKGFEIEQLTGQQRSWWIGLTYDLFDDFWIWYFSQEAPSYTSWTYDVPSGLEVSNFAYLENGFIFDWYNCSFTCNNINPICQINQ